MKAEKTLFARTGFMFAVLFVISFAKPAFAVNLLANGSFETAVGILANSTLAPGASNLSGWTVIGSGNLIWCDSSMYCNRPPSDGAFSLDLTGLTNVAPYAGVEQAIATTPGVAYALTFDLAGRSDSIPVSVRTTAGSTISTFTNASATWLTETMSFIATASTTNIDLVGVSAGGTGLDIQIDNAQVVIAAVPEPSASAMLLPGIAAILFMRRFFIGRRRSSKEPGNSRYTSAA